MVGIFPNDAALIRLAGALLLEQNDEWLVARRYLSEGSIAKALADERSFAGPGSAGLSSPEENNDNFNSELALA